MLTSSSFIKGARGELYGLVLLALIFVFVECGALKSKRLLFSFVIGVLLIIGLGCYISIERSGNFIHSFLTYHIVGFTLFSKYVQYDLHGLINPFGLQFSVVGGIDYLFSIFVRFVFFHDYASPILIQIYHQAQDVMVRSQYSHGGFSFVKFNTFYTVVLSLYQSGGVFGVLLGGATIGSCFTIVTHKNDSVYSKVISMYILYFVCMGIFSSPLEVPAFFLGLMVINIIYTFGLYMYDIRGDKLERCSK